MESNIRCSPYFIKTTYPAQKIETPLLKRFINISLLLLGAMLIWFCKSPWELNKTNLLVAQRESLITQLRRNKNYIVTIRDSLNRLVLSQDDRITSARYLVQEGRAKSIKAQAGQVLSDYPLWEPKLQPLVKIVESCEGHGVAWDVYCFGDMPYFGVEPILNVWIRQYELALTEIKMK